jgi:hypothetical protein
MRRMWFVIVLAASALLVIFLWVRDASITARSRAYPDLLASRLMKTSYWATVYYERNGRFAPDLEALQQIGLQASDARDPYSASGESLGYSAVITATGERCEFFTAAYKSPARIGVVARGAPTVTWSFTPEYSEFRRRQLADLTEGGGSKN